jgi:hypothetical protein
MIGDNEQWIKKRNLFKVYSQVRINHFKMAFI